MQLVIDKGDESLEGVIVTFAPDAKQPGDVAVRRTIARLHPELAVRIAVYQSGCRVHAPGARHPIASIGDGA